MIRLKAIAEVDAARLINFGASAAVGALAEEQLRGAVAAHNSMARMGVAYVADEVGMGKTYIALGVMGLIRHEHPGARVLIIAPRENIQRKWVKEHHNFVRKNWQVRDLRVQGLRETPARAPVICGSIEDFARQAVRNPDRDFFLRLTSFSLPLSGESREGWKAKRRALLEIAPRLRTLDFPLNSKEKFKEELAIAVNSVIPTFDLVIVDEGHNLKHGLQPGAAARNWALARVLGTERDQARTVPRAGHVLVLSATPFETDFKELWNQLQVLGVGHRDALEGLKDDAVTEAEKRRLVRTFLFRRLTELEIAGARHTKNMYRREWRKGGMARHDEPLAVPGERQQLVVALMQKKVAEILGKPKFNGSFQIGMLASFESFLRTAKVGHTSADEGETFDDPDQTDKDYERQGIDTGDVNQIAESYRRKFGEPLPHPKMDEVARNVARDLAAGEKTLVFVRRVKSVPELAAKLCASYDDWLKSRLQELLPGAVLHHELDGAFRIYREKALARRRAGSDFTVEAMPVQPEAATEEALVSAPEIEDQGGQETFFSWFFRGEGKEPRGYLTGAGFRRNRLQGDGAVLSTFFEDNYVAGLLGDPDDVLQATANALRRPAADVAEELRSLAAGLLKRRSGKVRRLEMFHAFQQAALRLLEAVRGELGREALSTRQARYGDEEPRQGPVPDSVPQSEPYLNIQTFFSELRRRPDLAKAILPTKAGGAGLSSRERFEDRERRRELLASVGRLGHTLVELWAVEVAGVGTMKAKGAGRTRGGPGKEQSLVIRFLNHLDRCRESAGLSAWHELSQVGQNHELLMDVNFPEARSKRAIELGRYFADALGNQLPVAGIFGGVPKKVVSQFRMPGYPLVLIATDVLQEGEDLHTFCSRVVHYGISWTPSAMEQRTGRIDRIGALTHRRLEGRRRSLTGDDRLQVFYPHLRDTVELLQVERVFERMNKFMRLAHRGGAVEAPPTIDTTRDFAFRPRDIAPLEGPLESAFEIDPRSLKGPRRKRWRGGEQAERVITMLHAMVNWLEGRYRVRWLSAQGQEGEFHGEAVVRGDVLLPASDRAEPDGKEVRVQPFALYLRSAGVEGRCLLHLVSPVGNWELNGAGAIRVARAQRDLGVKLCEVQTGVETYTLTAEGDLLFEPSHVSRREVADLLENVVVGADKMERHLERDQPYDVFKRDLIRESRHASD